MAVLMAYCAIAAIFEVNLQFAALLGGYGIVGGLHGSQRERFSAPIDIISKVSLGVFVPIYFGIIGYRLVFGRQFSFAILLVFLVGSSLISVFSPGLAAWLGGFRGLDVINIALTTNARGGPGIVLASVAMTQASSMQPFTPHWSLPPWSLRRWQEHGCASCFRRAGHCSPPIPTKPGNSARPNRGERSGMVQRVSRYRLDVAGADSIASCPEAETHATIRPIKNPSPCPKSWVQNQYSRQSPTATAASARIKFAMAGVSQKWSAAPFLRQLPKGQGVRLLSGDPLAQPATLIAWIYFMQSIYEFQV